MKNLLDITDLNCDEIIELIKRADDIKIHPEYYLDACHGKILGKMFFEPSTRTCLSFEAAMLGLGGNIVGFSDPNSSSVVKGESIADTVRVVSNYSDIIVMRHPKEGAPYVASLYSKVPVINAGDGGHHHPTQTLTDLMTIYHNKGKFEGLTVGLCGDLKYGRTVHSLIEGLSRYAGIKLVLISPEELRIPEHEMKNVIQKNNMQYVETTSLHEAINSLDILYMTRIQKERFDDAGTYERLKNSYILTKDLLRDAVSDLTIMHPLPRVNEISYEVDDDPRAQYFSQVENGKFIRSALIMKLLKAAEFNDIRENKYDEAMLIHDYVCQNAKCITTIEPEIKQSFKKLEDGSLSCIYCEKKI